MSALSRKLGRDLRRLVAPAISIAVLVGAGLGSYVAAEASASSLEASRTAFYADAELADVFVRVSRAPRAVVERVRAIAGVARAIDRVRHEARLTMPGTREPVSAELVSLPEPGEPPLDRWEVFAGRWPGAEERDAVVVSALFADEWKLAVGGRLDAVIDGHRASLEIVGIGVSPEFLWAAAPRTGMPDPRHFGVLAMARRPLARAAGFEGACNDLVATVQPGADLDAVLAAVDATLAPYGGLGSIGRRDQFSARLIEQKIAQVRGLSRSLPAVFLGVAAFLLNVLLARLVGTQREQIATMKALGVRTRELAAHYLSLAAIICTAGVALGLGIGAWGGRALLAVYAQYFRFPTYVVTVSPRGLAVAIAFAYLAALLGAWLGVRRVLAVPPAEAMRPEAPPPYRPGILDAPLALLPPVARMVARDLFRRPMRLAISALSIALATAIVVSGAVMRDSIEEVLRLQFEVSHRESITVSFDGPKPVAALGALAAVEGVVAVEGERQSPVRARLGHREKTTAIVALGDLDLHRLLGADRRPLALPVDGLAVSRVLADDLGARVGDVIELESLEGQRRRFSTPISAVVDDLLGVSAYARPATLARWLGEAPSVNVALLSVDARDVDATTTRLAAFPSIAAIDRPADQRALVRAEVADEFLALQLILIVFAAAIAVGVVYNNARIALELRSRDLSTMRILGFSRGELGVVLVGEQVVQVAFGIAPGLWLGRQLGAASLASIDKELMRVPATIAPAS